MNGAAKSFWVADVRAIHRAEPPRSISVSRIVLTVIGLLCVNGSAQSLSSLIAQYYSATNSLGLVTNGPIVLSLSYYARTNILPGPWSNSPIPPKTLPLDIQEQLLARRTQTVTQVYFFTNYVFEHFTAESLQNTVWTNFISHTNGRSTVVWSQRSHSPKWPERPPILKWNTDSLIWGMRGTTALSPCWEGEGSPGVIPITALTRRHGYTRGHGIRQDGFGKDFAGKRVWFLTSNNQVVQVSILREVVRTMTDSGRDYTLFLFNKDLPEAIEPMRVSSVQEVFSRCVLPDTVAMPIVFFYLEQGGNISANVPGFSVPIMKGGDSGSANMLPLPGELVFFCGRTTSAPSPQMQLDMDQLCRFEGLKPARYQMRWVDLTRFPKY